MGFLNRVLSIFPFNGYKSALGALLMILPKIWPGQPWGDVGTLVMDMGNLLLALGLFHKGIKETSKY